MQNSVVVQFKLCFLTFLTPPQVGEGARFYQQSWSAMWVNWACFLECPRQQYHFPSGTLCCFQTLLVFSHFLQTLILLRIKGRSRLGGGVWLRGLRCLTAPSSQATLDHIHRLTEKAILSIVWATRDHWGLTIPSIKAWIVFLSFRLHFHTYMIWKTFTYIWWLIMQMFILRPHLMSKQCFVVSAWLNTKLNRYLYG